MFKVTIIKKGEIYYKSCILNVEKFHPKYETSLL